ncbi:MAG: phosphonate ABC transporter, permease protein PhnE [Alphaproteobacteria bacterium]|nr:phosphonate ABC transporter, permease protein PhnE [Alphaproteobacteria bacterium]
MTTTSSAAAQSAQAAQAARLSDSDIDARFADVMRASRRQRFWPIGLAIGTVLYLIYAWIAFDMTSLVQQSRMDRAAILALDSFAYKVHVTKDLRGDGAVSLSIEGARQGGFDEDPSWVQRRGDAVEVDLGDGYRVTLQDASLTLLAPGLEPIRARVGEDGAVSMTGPQPEWLKVNERRFEARPELFKRVRMTRTRIEVHRYFYGWENFWFDYSSPFYGMSLMQAWSYAGDAPQIEEGASNRALLLENIWRNQEWQHGEVFKALLETILMALLGTMVASLVGLPLAFAAASNFNRLTLVRIAIRRVFDFLRGIDNLIWSLIFIRAFGLGPLTGIMAIAFTDTGTLGKLYSEALENIDGRQVDGVKSTGASSLQRYRFGVIPQILPVFIAQSLYYLESNTRSATVIGALGAGGIGLKLVETLRTGQDWENTFYIILLTLAVVIAMDIFSGWLRRKLIKEG